MKDGSGLASEMTYRDWLIGRAIPFLFTRSREREYKTRPSDRELAAWAAMDANLLADAILETRKR